MIVLTLSSRTILFLALGGTVIAFAFQWILSVWVLPREGNRVAEIYNVPRRHLESYGSWWKRIHVARDAHSAASSAFYSEAWKAKTVHKNGHGGLVAELPKSHPASVAFLAAKYPDGPPIEDLLAIAGSPPQNLRSLN